MSTDSEVGRIKQVLLDENCDIYMFFFEDGQLVEVIWEDQDDNHHVCEIIDLVYKKFFIGGNNREYPITIVNSVDGFKVINFSIAFPYIDFDEFVTSTGGVVTFEELELMQRLK